VIPAYDAGTDRYDYIPDIEVVVSPVPNIATLQESKPVIKDMNNQTGE
jgi:hypothetical protein